MEIQLKVSLNLAQNGVLWTASRSGRFTPKTQVIHTAKHTSSAHVCRCFTCTADCTHLNVTQLCFMMESKVAPTCGKLTQLADTLQVQNINMLLHLTLHSSVRYTHTCFTLLCTVLSTIHTAAPPYCAQFCPLYTQLLHLTVHSSAW